MAAKKAQHFVAMDIYEKDIAKLEINMSDNNTGLLDAQAKLRTIEDDLVINVVSSLFEGLFREIQQSTSDLISEFQDMDSDFDPNSTSDEFIARKSDIEGTHTNTALETRKEPQRADA